MKRDSKLILILADVSTGTLSLTNAVPEINNLYEQQPSEGEIDTEFKRWMEIEHQQSFYIPSWNVWKAAVDWALSKGVKPVSERDVYVVSFGILNEHTVCGVYNSKEDAKLAEEIIKEDSFSSGPHIFHFKLAALKELTVPKVSEARIDEMVNEYQPLSYNTGTGAEKRIRSYFKDGVEATIKELNQKR